MKKKYIQDNKDVCITAINRILDCFLDEIEEKGFKYPEINEESEQWLKDYKAHILDYEEIRNKVYNNIPLSPIENNQLILIIGTVANLMDKQVKQLSFASRQLREITKKLAK